MSDQTGFEMQTRYRQRAIPIEWWSTALRFTLTVVVIGLLMCGSTVSWSQSMNGMQAIAGNEPMRLRLSDRTEWVGLLRNAQGGRFFLELANKQLVRVEVSDVESLAVGEAVYATGEQSQGAGLSPWHGHRDSGLVEEISSPEIERAVMQYENGIQMRQAGFVFLAAADVLSYVTIGMAFVGAGGDDTTTLYLTGITIGSALVGALLSVTGGKKRKRNQSLYRALQAMEGDAERTQEVSEGGEDRSQSFAVVPGFTRGGGGASFFLSF
jgi:hypothetical protein